MEFIVTDMKGSTRRKFAFNVGAGNSEYVLNVSDLAAGVYFLTGYMNGNKTHGIRFVKQ